MGGREKKLRVEGGIKKRENKKGSKIVLLEGQHITQHIKELTLVRWKVWSVWMRAMASVAPLNP